MNTSSTSWRETQSSIVNSSLSSEKSSAKAAARLRFFQQKDHHHNRKDAYIRITKQSTPGDRVRVDYYDGKEAN